MCGGETFFNCGHIPRMLYSYKNVHDIHGSRGGSTKVRLCDKCENLFREAGMKIPETEDGVEKWLVGK